MEQVFDGFVELSGDGRVATDPCLRGGLATLHSWRCIVMGTCKGHTPGAMQQANYGMPTPAGCAVTDSNPQNARVLCVLPCRASAEHPRHRDLGNTLLSSMSQLSHGPQAIRPGGALWAASRDDR